MPKTTDETKATEAQKVRIRELQRHLSSLFKQNLAPYLVPIVLMSEFIYGFGNKTLARGLEVAELEHKLRSINQNFPADNNAAARLLDVGGDLLKRTLAEIWALYAYINDKIVTQEQVHLSSPGTIYLNLLEEKKHCFNNLNSLQLLLANPDNAVNFPEFYAASLTIISIPLVLMATNVLTSYFLKNELSFPENLSFEAAKKRIEHLEKKCQSYQNSVYSKKLIGRIITSIILPGMIYALFIKDEKHHMPFFIYVFAAFFAAMAIMDLHKDIPFILNKLFLYLFPRDRHIQGRKQFLEKHLAEFGVNIDIDTDDRFIINFSNKSSRIVVTKALKQAGIEVVKQYGSAIVINSNFTKSRSLATKLIDAINQENANRNFSLSRKAFKTQLVKLAAVLDVEYEITITPPMEVFSSIEFEFAVPKHLEKVVNFQILNNIFNRGVIKKDEKDRTIFTIIGYRPINGILLEQFIQHIKDYKQTLNKPSSPPPNTRGERTAGKAIDHLPASVTNDDDNLVPALSDEQITWKDNIKYIPGVASENEVYALHRYSQRFFTQREPLYSYLDSSLKDELDKVDKKLFKRFKQASSHWAIRSKGASGVKISASEIKLKLQGEDVRIIGTVELGPRGEKLVKFNEIVWDYHKKLKRIK